MKRQHNIGLLVSMAIGEATVQEKLEWNRSRWHTENEGWVSYCSEHNFLFSPSYLFIQFLCWTFLFWPRHISWNCFAVQCGKEPSHHIIYVREDDKSQILRLTKLELDFTKATRPSSSSTPPTCQRRSGTGGTPLSSGTSRRTQSIRCTPSSSTSGTGARTRTGTGISSHCSRHSRSSSMTGRPSSGHASSASR